MIVYKVQTHLDSVGGYDNVVAFNPDYVWSVMKFKRYWPLPWPFIEIGVVMNLRKAEKAALEKALNHAKVLRRRIKTRILRVTTLNGTETKDIIWDNGNWLDLKEVTWYWRPWCWFFNAKDKTGKARS